MTDTTHRTPTHVRRYYTLDGLRGLAALMVAIYHLGQWTVAAVPHGYLAVDFFFMLSGFVIALNYQHRLKYEMSFAQFVRSRLIRVYPMFLLGLVIGVPERALRANLNGITAYNMADVPTFFSNIFMVPSPFNHFLFPFNGALWSLFIEVVISLMFGALLYRASNRSLILMSLSAAASLAFIFVKPDNYIDLGWSWPTLVGGFARAGFAFPLGVLMYRWSDRVKFRETSLAYLAIFLLVLTLTSLPGKSAAADLFAVFLIMPFTLAVGIIFEPPPSARRICSVLGNLSYPAYAIHSPLVVAAVFLTVGSGIRFFTLFVIFLLVLAATAIVTSKYIETPARAWLNRRIPSPKALLSV